MADVFLKTAFFNDYYPNPEYFWYENFKDTGYILEKIPGE